MSDVGRWPSSTPMSVARCTAEPKPSADPATAPSDAARAAAEAPVEPPAAAFPRAPMPAASIPDRARSAAAIPRLPAAAPAAPGPKRASNAASLSLAPPSLLFPALLVVPPPPELMPMSALRRFIPASPLRAVTEFPSLVTVVSPPRLERRSSSPSDPRPEPEAPRPAEDSRSMPRSGGGGRGTRCIVWLSERPVTSLMRGKSSSEESESSSPAGLDGDTPLPPPNDCAPDPELGLLLPPLPFPEPLAFPAPPLA